MPGPDGDALLLDIVSFLFYQFVVTYWAYVLRTYIPVQFTPTKFLLSIPLPLRVVAYGIVGELANDPTMPVLVGQSPWCEVAAREPDASTSRKRRSVRASNITQNGALPCASVAPCARASVRTSCERGWHS
jgi:hypothetical protein